MDKHTMINKSLLRLLWNHRFRRFPGGWKASGHSRVVKKATADKLIADGLARDMGDDLVLTPQGRTEISVSTE